jgi:hypothetical protein
VGRGRARPQDSKERITRQSTGRTRRNVGPRHLCGRPPTGRHDPRSWVLQKVVGPGTSHGRRTGRESALKR